MLSLFSDIFSYELSVTHFDNVETDVVSGSDRGTQLSGSHQNRVIHRFDFNIINRFRFAINIGAHFVMDSPFDLRMFNPMAIVHNWNNNSESIELHEGDESNNILSFEFEAAIIPRLTLTSQFVLDQMKLPTETDSSVDGVAPTIELNGESAMSIVQNQPFIDPGVLNITDNVDKIIPIENIEIFYYYSIDEGQEKEQVSEIDTSKIGFYYIYYRVSDSSGNIATAIRLVNIKEETVNSSEEPSSSATPEPTFLPETSSAPTTPDSTDFLEQEIQQKRKYLRDILEQYLKELYDTTTIYDPDWNNDNQEATISVTLEEINSKFSFDLSMFHTDNIECDFKSTYGTIHFYRDGSKSYTIQLQCLYKYENNYYNIK